MQCPNCQTDNPATAKFCFNCGSSLEVARPVEGERRIVTVLFADVAGSTAMAERLDPEQVTEIMNGAFSFLNAAVARYEGTVSRIMGDAILAFFGAPVAHEDDAERAIRAGIEIQEAAADYQNRIERAYGIDFRIRIGINTGLVVIAFVGDQVRTEYTVMGDTVNVASRLQATAEPGTILLSQETYRLVRHLFDVSERGPVWLKGKSSPVETYEIIGTKTARGTGRGLEGITSVIVGRDDELARLHARVDALSARGAIMAVVGEAGVGKSRLIAELRKSSGANDPDGPVWVESRALSYEQTSAYYPWRDIIRSLIGASQGDTLPTVREHLQRLQVELGLSQASASYLGALLGVPSSSDGDIDVPELQDSSALIADAVRDLLAAIAAQRPVVIVIDDLHWADRSSLGLIHSVAEMIPAARVLMVVVLRPERHAPSWEFVEAMRLDRDDVIEEIHLAPLDPAKSGELLGNLLYVEELPESVRLSILQKSEGNPFFLEEIIRSLVDSGHIVRHNSHWRATSDIVDVTLPDTLIGVLSARIDRLPDDTRRVAQVASIIGRIFTYRVLKAVCETVPLAERIAEPMPHLDLLTYEELLRQRARHPDPEFVFKHVLTQEAAYSLLLVRTRREYHRRVAEALELIHQDHLEEAVESLAFHAWHAEDWLNAARFSLLAGTRAIRQLRAFREANEHFERAWQAIEQSDDPPADMLIDIVLTGMNTALKVVSDEELLKRLERAEHFARALGDKARLAQVLHWIAHVHITNGLASRAYAALVENHQLAEELGDERLQIYPAWAMALDLLNNDPKSAVLKLTAVAEVARHQRLSYVESHAIGSVAVGYSRLGRFEQAEEMLRRAHEIADRADTPVAKADAHLLSANVYFDMGDYARGLEHGRIGTNLALQTKALDCAAFGYCIVGLNTLELPDPNAALQTYQESSKFVDSATANHRLMNEVQTGMAIARFETGHTDSLKDIEDSLVTSRALNDRFTLALVGVALGRAYMALGRYDEAALRLNDAIAAYEQANMYPHWIRALRTLADLYERQGDPARAGETRQKASRVEDEMHVAARLPLAPDEPQFDVAATAD